MKKISVVVPCYNEEENVIPISKEIVETITKELPQYDYELLFIDNCSKDTTRDKLRILAMQNHKIKVILNAKNFGQFNSPFYGMLQTSGDCTIVMCADFQDPVEMIPVFVKEWENGNKIVSAIKTTSKENKVMYFLRSIYYKLIKKMSDVEQIEHFTGFGLYDKDFIEILRNLDDPSPFLRGIVAELGYKRKDVPYEQQKRRGGKSSNNWYRLYDAAMLSVTSYTKICLRIATFFGFFCSAVSGLIAIIYLILKLVHWNTFQAGIAPAIIGLFFMSSIQMIFLGIMGEYIMNINTRIMKRPLVIEEERINFEED